MQDRKLVGIGVDLVSWKRVERLLSEHPDKSFEHLLAPAEQKKFQSASSRLDFFARSFAAKEAYFKAAGGAGMGEEGFREIEIEMKGKERFYAWDRHCEGAKRPKQSTSLEIAEPVPSPEIASASAEKRGGGLAMTGEGSRLRRPPRKDGGVDGQFFTTPDGIGAQILIWQ